MFDDIFDRLGGLDTKKISEAVNFVWTNRAQLAEIIERLPTLLRETGESIEAAGSSAVKASAFLTGSGKAEGGVRHLAAVAADALDEGQQELSEVAEMIARIGQELDRVAIPSVKPRFAEVAGFRVMNGLDVGRESLFDDVTERMSGGAARLSAMSKNLATVSEQLREMGDLLQGMGGDLDRVGSQLEKSGKTLRSLGDMGGKK